MSDSPEHKPNTTRNAPVGSVDMMAFREDDTPYEIWPCDHCLPWHVEVVHSEGEIIVREWHAVDCPLFLELIDD